MATTPSRITYSEDGQIQLPVDPNDPGYAVDALIRQGKMEEARAELERLLLEGMDSGPGVPATPEFYENIRARLRQRANSRR